MSCCNKCNTSPCCCSGPQRYCGIDVDCLGLTSGQAYDTIFANFANEICDLQTAIDGLQGLDHVSFTSSTGTPSTQPNQPCETDTYTFWADISETVSLGTFTIANPCTSAEYADVAWVDLYWGNDTTGQAGRFDLPFATVAAALQASSFVFLRQGTYTESIELTDGMVIYAEPGVIFTAGGIVYFPPPDPPAAPTGAFLGYARFTSFSRPVLLPFEGNLRFECDFVDVDASCFYVGLNASLVAHTNYVRSNANDGGFMNSFRDSANIELHIKEFCEGMHFPWYFSGQNTKSFTGTARIYCPISRILEGGPYGATSKAVVNIEWSEGADIQLFGDIECSNTTPDAATNMGCLRFRSNTVTPSVVKVTGDIIGGNQVGIYNGYRALGTNLTVKGNVTSNLEPILVQQPNWTNSIDVKLSFFNSIIQGSASTTIGQGVTAYFYNCSFYNDTDADEVIDINDDTTAGAGTASNLYFYNCVGEGTGTTSFITDVNIVGVGFATTVGLSFSNANKALGGTVTDAWGGFAQIAALVVPKL